MVLPEENLTAEELVRQVAFLYTNRQEFIAKMSGNVTEKLGAIAKIVSILDVFWSSLKDIGASAGDGQLWLKEIS